MLGSLGVVGAGIVPTPVNAQPTTCNWFLQGFPGASWICGVDNPHVATPPTPSIDLWTIAPTDQAQAEAVVQSISNQTVARQQAIDGNLITPVSTWGVPASLIPDPSVSGDITPWLVYGVLGVALVALVIGGGRRR